MSRRTDKKDPRYLKHGCLRKDCKGKLRHRDYSLWDCDQCGSLHYYKESTGTMILDNKKSK